MSSKDYGTLIKEIRFANGENMADMSEWIEAKLPFLSAVESGKKKVPDDWFDKIVNHYNLSEEQKEELKEAIVVSKTMIKINLSNVDSDKRRLAIQFQRSFTDLDSDKVKTISNILGDYK